MLYMTDALGSCRYGCTVYRNGIWNTKHIHSSTRLLSLTEKHWQDKHHCIFVASAMHDDDWNG